MLKKLILLKMKRIDTLKVFCNWRTPKKYLLSPQMLKTFSL